MSYKLFTDASYSPIKFIGFISIDIYNEDNSLVHSVDIKCENEKKFYNGKNWNRLLFELHCFKQYT